MAPRVRRVVLPLAAIVALGCGDDSPSAPGTNGSGPGGSVTRHKTGEGVAGVVAVLLSAGRVVETAHTDAAGDFRFTTAKAGPYTVRLTGFEIAGLDSRFDAVEPVSQDIVVGGDPAALVFTVVGLIPPRITGEVFCGGAPVAGARVRVVGGNADVTVTTNAQGKYAALDLVPGHYAVIPVSMPCAVTPGFEAVELRPGQSGEVDFTG